MNRLKSVLIIKITMIRSYFNELEKYEKLYGEKTLLLWQCGSFFEVYGKKKDDEIYGSKIKEFSSICDMTIANKIKCKDHKDGVVMAGFSPISRLDKYLPKLNKEGYTVAVWTEEEEDHTHRKEYGIFSPGTNFNIQKRSITNNIMCLWIEKNESSIKTTIILI